MAKTLTWRGRGWKLARKKVKKVTQQDIFFLHFGAMVTIDILFITSSFFLARIKQSDHIYNIYVVAHQKLNFRSILQYIYWCMIIMYINYVKKTT